MFPTETADTETARCNIVADAATALEALGIEGAWECLAAGAIMGASFELCEAHYREMLQRISDHVTSELVKGQMN